MEYPSVQKGDNHMDYKKIKEKTVVKLKENYTLIIVSMLLYILVESLFQGTSFLISNKSMDILFNILITGLLYEGFLQILIKTYRGKKTNIMELFSRTDLFWKTTAITILLTFLTVLCGLIGAIAGSTLYMFIYHAGELNIFLSSAMILAGVILCTCIAAFYSYLIISFSQSYNILYDNEKMPVLEIFNKSMDLLEDTKIDYIMFNLPYLLWIVLGIMIYAITKTLNNPGWMMMSFIILIVVIFWEIPNMLLANIGFYEELKKLETRQ